MIRRACFLAAWAWMLIAANLATGQGINKDNLDSILKALPPRCIGPGAMSGRVTDLAVVEKKPAVFYVASASGGLWKTVNNGTTFTPLFEREGTVSIGAVAVSQSHPEIVWVGTGEANARNSVSWGDGVYQSTDGGQSWNNMGLRDSHSIGRIVIHPTNPDIVYVAALGHLWGPSKERGLYKTTDAGKTWTLSKFIDEHTGFIDVAMDPSDPDTLYAAAYQVRRDAFSGGNPAILGGPGSGLYRTTDGGKNWHRMSAGLPLRPLGRCGLSIYRKDPSTVFAVVQTDLTSSGTAGQEANLKDREITSEFGKKQKLPITADDGGVFRSDDNGKTWRQVNSLCPRPFYYGQIRVDPADVNRVYVLGINFHVSRDGGKTFVSEDQASGTHADYHALWIDTRDSDHLILGCDGGLNFSYDRGANWEYLKNLPISQFYAVAVDMRKPYRIFGGLQDNGTWGCPSATRDQSGIAISDWFSILGFDGFYCQGDPTEADSVYCEGQYGMLRRVNVRTGQTWDIKPHLPFKASGGMTSGNIKNVNAAAVQLRFNWSTPFQVSPHNPRALHVGSSHVLRSINRGTAWEIISPDLTLGQPGSADAAAHTISTLAESPLKAGLLFVGTDDGRLHVTRDGGAHWDDLSDKLSEVPGERWISRVECSRAVDQIAYLAIDRHRNDDRRPYVFRTTSGGTKWENITRNLPVNGCVHVVREDPRNPDLLYVGTEFGLFLSLDRGATWHRHGGLPTVAVHDLLIHPRDHELVIATHGRGIWIMDVAPLQELTPKIRSAPAHLFGVKSAAAFRPRSGRVWEASRTFLGSNPPFGAQIYFHLGQAVADAPRVVISDSIGNKVADLVPAGKNGGAAGLHAVVWNLASGDLFGVELAPAGDYLATLHVDGKTYLQRFRVEHEQ
jgi:photosystem II stability/assembly factor-like uncharacterized protein